MTKHKIAGIISFIFNHTVEMPILLAVILPTRGTAPIWVLMLVVLIDTLLPILFLIYGLKRGFISDWETSNRDERHIYNFFALLLILFNLVLFYFLGDEFLLKLIFVFLALILIYTLITFFWKISGHMASNTAFILLLNIFFDWRFRWLIFLLPLVAWARLTRNKHDVWQLAGGVVLSTLVILCGTSLLF